MKRPLWLCVLLVFAAANGFTNDDRRWENPVFETAEEAVAAAENAKRGPVVERSPAMQMFLEFVLGTSASAGTTVDRFYVTRPESVGYDPVQQRTVDRFEGAIPRQRRVVERRLARFGFPALPGLVFCRLVDSVDAFSGLNPASSDRMSRVGGVTYYCRYIVLPLSYVGADNLRELRTSVALNPGLDYESTVRRWQKESYASLVSTFRHELVHVHTNSILDVPVYSDRARYPTWFHEGTATYLAGDPHSGLSPRYRDFQNLFFYLVQRHGVHKLQDFYETVLGGSDVAGALSGVYAISGSDELFQRSGRWHWFKGKVHAALWIVALGLVATAIGGRELPVIGGLLLLLAAGFVFALVSGLAPHLFGLNGPAAVLAAQLVFGLAALAAGTRGIIRIRRRRAT